MPNKIRAVTKLKKRRREGNWMARHMMSRQIISLIITVHTCHISISSIALVYELIFLQTHILHYIF